MNYPDSVSKHLENALKRAADRAAAKNKIIEEEDIIESLLEDGSYATRILNSCNVTMQRLKGIEVQIRSIRKNSWTNEVDFSPEVKTDFSIANDIVFKYDDGGGYFIGTEAMLYAIFAESASQNKKGSMRQILEKFLEVNPKDITEKCLYYIKGGSCNASNKPKIAAAGAADEDAGENERTEASAYSSLPSAIADFGIDLTARAKINALDPVIGREKEIEKVIQILCRRTKNNPVLVGEPGVGKSAVVEGLAQAIVSGDVPEILAGRTVFSLDMASVVAGTKYRGEFEERFRNIIGCVRRSGNIVLFIDEIHNIVGAGSSSDGALDASNIIKPMLARGELQTIGATTLDEYRTYIEKDAALERRFTPVLVEQPSVEETIVILRGLKDKYEAHHSVYIEDSALLAAAQLSDRYITDRFLPDKAIDLVDEACAKARMSAFQAPKRIHELEVDIKKKQNECNNYSSGENIFSSASLREEIASEIAELESLKNAWGNEKLQLNPRVGREDIAKIVSGKNLSVIYLSDN